MLSIVQLATSSVIRFVRLLRSGNIRNPENRLGNLYQIDQGGTYRIFRETMCTPNDSGSTGVVVVGFRLRLIGSNPVCDWMFQRVCLLTTPFWSGIRGFRVKLWMVEPQTKDYLGIYSWAGADHARRYAEALIRVLRLVSTRGSVWYEQYPDVDLDSFLQERAIPDREYRSASDPAGMTTAHG